MKQLLLFLFLFFLSISIQAQTVTVRDAETQVALPVVTISSQDSKVFVTTDKQGQADLSGFKGAETIQLRLLGYKKQVLSYHQIEENDFQVFLQPTSFTMDHMVISATRWQQTSENVPSKISRISPETVSLQNPQTAADLLQLSGEVFIQKSQQGGGSPMIRGFATNRLLYAVDGVRMNTAIFRGGNIQNVISLDPFAIENTEVLFGPGSVIYGSDAIGGVMSFQTLTPEFSMDDELNVHGSAAIRTSSANNEQTGHFDVNVGGQNWAFVSSLSSFDYGHLRQGSNGPDDYLKPTHVEAGINSDKEIVQTDPLLQVPSAYSQLNLMQKIRYKASNQWEFNYGFHHSETSPYGRYDRHNRVRDGNPRYAEWKYGPQKWTMNHLKINHTYESGLYDQLSLSMAHQSFKESRISRNFNQAEREIRTEDVDAYSINADFMKFTGDRNTLYFGAEYVINDVQSTGINEQIDSGNRQPGPSRYPDATWQSIAAYLNDDFQYSDKFTFQAGIRYNHVILDADFDTQFYPFPFDEANVNNGSLTGSIGGIYKPNSSWLISANLSTAFRAPNVDDIGKIFDSEPGAVVVPNPDLSAEYAYNADLGIAHTFGEAVNLDLTGYYTLLNNAMVRRNFTLNGSDSLIYDGIPSQVQALQNAANARVYGLQAGLQVEFNHGLSLSSDFNIQKGEEEMDDGTISPSRHAAPWFGVTRLQFDNQPLELELNAYYQGEKKHDELSVSEQGKDEIYALDAEGQTYAPAWYTLNFKARYQLSETLETSAGVENITDQRYRPYSSGISGPGRNFILSLKMMF
ncbi:TonB-dependent receptor [Gracilimonas mengyeensis]|uniref:Hemoglobin/transferrin/lactoferrin receptor protein n=1 Tax=Gracilimonas mengyeensis TaxID=1302730 RepID=A0A521EAA4_9BACT|nr:TonB-dependent receptor [Gracilimonas mengyeensis]SMO80702.1 hemoglobin/transferrin/lactoferrin receptor protein [Gracilimonas mengyeensis]